MILNLQPTFGGLRSSVSFYKDFGAVLQLVLGHLRWPQIIGLPKQRQPELCFRTGRTSDGLKFSVSLLDKIDTRSTA